MTETTRVGRLVLRGDGAACEVLEDPGSGELIRVARFHPWVLTYLTHQTKQEIDG